MQREAELLARHARAEPVPPGAVAYAGLASPLGTIWMASGPNGLLAVEHGVGEAEFCHAVERMGHGPTYYSPPVLATPMTQVREYLAGERRGFDLAVDLRGCTPFQRTVLTAISDIPWGEVRSYGEIARDVGRPAGARAVGGAVAASPLSIVVPCHRVTRGDGSAGEYALHTLGSCGRHYKLMLLSIEGFSFG
ncbi:MAG TPA: methylated-DNA--[protein]-cysteine S-methyltransferase [Chloroflexota bacterium]|nr:methylated-DNA--[protein]-cysteine S-methyltransferase [Chloroflexota bacterium]